MEYFRSCPSCSTVSPTRTSKFCVECGYNLKILKVALNTPQGTLPLPGEEGEVLLEEVKTQFTKDELVNFLEEYGIALSVTELRKLTDLSYSDAQFMLQDLQKSGLIVDGKQGTEDYFWAKKYKMTPSKNLIGPFFVIKKKIIKKFAAMMIKDSLKKILYLKVEEIDEINIQNLPLWRIETINIGMDNTNERDQFYVNGMNGGIMDVNFEEKSLQFIFNEDEASRLQTPKADRLDWTQIQPSEFSESFHSPSINRETACGIINSRLSKGISYNIYPALIWLPVFQFKIEGEIIETKRYMWMDAVFGFPINTDPFSRD